MYWVPTDDTRKHTTLIHVMSPDSQEAADRRWKAFAADPDWIKLREASEADGKIPAKPPKRIYMKRAHYSASR